MTEQTLEERKKYRDEQVLAHLREKPKTKESAVKSPPKPKAQ